jgi:S-adenosylmethionine-dependent methyltransferase
VKSVERFYDEHARLEWERHDRQRMEFAITMRVLEDYLPKAPVRVLDVGGGPGWYAIALTQRGYAATLVDVSRECLELARRKAAEAGVELAGYMRGSATHLRLPDESYAAVLMMGPMYHLLTVGQRRKAVCEAARVLRKGGVLFASFVTRDAVIRDAAKREPELLAEDPGWIEAIVKTGRFRPQPGRGYRGFIDSYLARPSEIAPFMERASFRTLALVACEGVVSMIDEKVNALAGREWDAWVDLNYRLGKDPSVHGCAEHLLYVGKKS